MNGAGREIWVLGETIGQTPCPHTLELIGKAAALAEQSGGAVFCLTDNLKKDACGLLFAAGCSRVFLYGAPWSEYVCSRILADYARQAVPDIILGSATVFGRSVMPQTAALLKTGLTADCTGLSMTEDGLLLQTRPAFGGNLTADILCARARPQMATVRPKIFPPPALDDQRSGEIVSIPRKDGMREPVRVVSRIPVPGQSNISEAEIIIAGGAGIGSKEGFSRLYELARLLGGAVGASRAAVNAGYADSWAQIGLTGSTVRPRLYLAFGISGAVQHTAGMRSAGKVIAVNTDPRAPIFDYSDIAVIADWQETLDALLRELSD